MKRFGAAGIQPMSLAYSARWALRMRCLLLQLSMRPARPPQVTLAKPLGVKFARGNDGGAYVVRSDPKLGNTDSRVRRLAGAAACLAGGPWLLGTESKLGSYWYGDICCYTGTACMDRPA